MSVMPHSESPALARGQVLHPQRQGLGRCQVCPGNTSHPQGLSLVEECCCSPCSTVQHPPQAHHSPQCRQGWQPLDCQSPARYSPGPPGNLQVFPWAQGLRSQTSHAWDEVLKSVKTPFPSCTRSSFDTSLSALPGCPSTHRCTGMLPALLTPCLPCSPPASPLHHLPGSVDKLTGHVGSEADVQQDQTSLLYRFRCLL